MSQTEPNNIKSNDLCDRCAYDVLKFRGYSDGTTRKCWTIQWGTPCPYFKESEE